MEYMTQAQRRGVIPAARHRYQEFGLWIVDDGNVVSPDLTRSPSSDALPHLTPPGEEKGSEPSGEAILQMVGLGS